MSPRRFLVPHQPSAQRVLRKLHRFQPLRLGWYHLISSPQLYLRLPLITHRCLSPLPLRQRPFQGIILIHFVLLSFLVHHKLHHPVSIMSFTLLQFLRPVRSEFYDASPKTFPILSVLWSSNLGIHTDRISSQSKHRHSYAGGHSAAVAVPVAAGTTGFGGWSESYSQSPSYTSSSGYASPILGPGDYANLFALPPYGPGINRTRTSSNASFIEPWSYPSRSPTSTASTMAYNWSSSDKTPTAPGLAYMGTSYPMTSMPLSACIDSMTAYGPFGPRSMVQRDEEEGAFLFGEQPYGMGPAAHTYPFEQYLDYFWRLFHPTFPIVHRPTFERMNPSPMLHAAMIALGGQYSHDTSVKQNSRSLHDRCIKLLARVSSHADRSVQEC